MWTYHQRLGTLYRADGELLGQGYAGRNGAKNNPDDQHLPNMGPIPRGTYTIEPPIDTKTHGPYVLWLEPNHLNAMYGRSGFGIHGDSVVHPGTASEGCIVLPRSVRQLIWASGDHQLEVIA